MSAEQLTGMFVGWAKHRYPCNFSSSYSQFRGASVNVEFISNYQIDLLPWRCCQHYFSHKLHVFVTNMYDLVLSRASASGQDLAICQHHNDGAIVIYHILNVTSNGFILFDAWRRIATQIMIHCQSVARRSPKSSVPLRYE